MEMTDELRRMLDERGVEYMVDHGYREFFWDFGESGMARASAIGTRGLVQMTVTGITPAQAVEATMGRGECKVVSSIRHDYEGGYAGTEYEHRLSCGDTVWWSNDDAPDYCPWCGREVVSE